MKLERFVDLESKWLNSLLLIVNIIAIVITTAGRTRLNKKHEKTIDILSTMNKYMSTTSTVGTTSANNVVTGSASNHHHLHHHYHQNQQLPLDGYEAEIVEDIPEQFDLSRYKKAAAKSAAVAVGGVGQQVLSQQPYACGYLTRQAPMPPSNPHQQQAYLYHQQQQFSASYMHTTGILFSNDKNS